MYGQNNEYSFYLIENIWQNVTLAITGATKGTSQIDVNNQLELDSLKFTRFPENFVNILDSEHFKFFIIYKN